ncbi:[FeFe] hydrogenase H-cluster maturation GTPase HydF [Pseudomonadota bacterium]
MRYAITLIGRTNAGKSSLINAICEQNVSIVSKIPGTTTDTIGKAYELIGFGPVVFYDTAGLDDKSELGQKRQRATLKTLKNSDFTIVVIGDGQLTDLETNLINQLTIPHLIVYTKSDIIPNKDGVSAKTREGIAKLRTKLVSTIPIIKERTILDGLVKKTDKVLLVCPIDQSAPKGRLILPQVQVTREILDMQAIAITVQPKEISEALKLNPNLVITDSQAIKEVAKIVPFSIPLTTFSILFGRLKGDYITYLEGAKSIDILKDGDKILIAEACSHITVEDDIGRDKLPILLKKYTGKNLQFEFSKGKHFPDDLNSFALILHCGSCMLTRTETLNRIETATDANIPITNYGMTLSKCQGLLERVVNPILINKKLFKKNLS